METGKRESFGNKFGVLMAMAGSAIGLGNMWRFPYLTAENGGAAFILIYIVLMLTISLPTMITEYMIGRRSRANAFYAYGKLGFPRRRYIGLFAVMASIFVLSFYCVVGGWTIKYMINAFMLHFQSAAADYSAEFNSFASSTISPLIYTFIFLLLTTLVVCGGVRQGIERFSKIMMTMLFIIIILIAIRSLTLPGSAEGIRYLLVPDFSKVTGHTWSAALGQSFFSLGLGCGAILVYGSYVKTEENLVMTALTTALADTLFAIVAGLAIIPAIFAIVSINGTVPDINAGPGLVFITLPGIFASMPLGTIAAILFFVSMLLAAITSSVSLFESGVTFFCEVFHIRRLWGSVVTFCICAVLGLFCSLSQGKLAHIRIVGLNIFDFFDKTSSNVLMTGSCLLMVLFAGWTMKKEDFMDELSGHGKSGAQKWLLATNYYLVKYISPLGIIAIIISTFFM